MFQDAAGTVPVTAVGQPVGLMLDKSKGLVLGPELVTNGNFSQGTTGWTNTSTGSGTATVTGGQAVLVGVDVSNRGKLTSLNFTTAIGKPYLLTWEVVSGTANSQIVITGGSTIFDKFGATVPGKFQAVVVAAATSTAVSFNVYGAGTVVFDNISVRELPGNHAFNPSGNSANFPVLSARYNLAAETEFRNGLTDAPTRGGLISATTLDGYLGALAFGYDGATSSYAYKTGIAIAGVPLTVSVVVEMTDGLAPAFGSATVGSVSNDFYLVVGGNGGTFAAPTAYTVTRISGTNKYRVSATGTPSTIITNTTGILKVNTNSSRTFKVTAYDLRVTNDALNQPAYQRVNTATDYDTVGFKPYLSFNGVNQWLQTNSIDFTYGDKMFVSAGVRKLSDAARGIVTELGNNQLQAVKLEAPNSANPQYYWTSAGSTVGTASYVNAAVAAPITNVLSGIGDISGDQAILRVNGAQAAISTADQGTGNYGNYPLYIGARASTSLFFNGRLYGLVVAGKQATSDEITNTESFLAIRTGYIRPGITGIPTIQVSL